MRTPLFPESYSHWLSARLPLTVEETLATCDACAMVSPSGLTRDPGPFDGTLKCCTYFPFVPNFGLGAMLESGASLRIQVAARSGLMLPLGLFASPEREQLSRELGPEAFGQRRELLCPFFDTAALGCSVWRNRPGVCTTYFCKSDRGAAGLEFWADIETYLNQFEWTLANEVVLRMGFTLDEIEMSEAAMLTDGPGEERDFLISRAWAEWSTRREEFLLECTRRARTITGKELDTILGPELLEFEARLRG